MRIYSWRVTTTNDFSSHDFVYVFCIYGHASFASVDVHRAVCVGDVVAFYEIAFVQQQNVQKWQGESISSGRFFLLLFCFRVFTHFRTFLNCKFIVVLWHRICLVPLPPIRPHLSRLYKLLPLSLNEEKASFFFTSSHPCGKAVWASVRRSQWRLNAKTEKNK